MTTKSYGTWRYGALRITHDPSWSAAYPFKCYSGGTAMRIFGSLEAAMFYFSYSRATFKNWTHTP